MDWYYSADGKDRIGPVSEEHIRAKIVEGVVKPDTLVWNATLPKWQPASATALVAPADGKHACIITGKRFTPSQMIQTEHGWVSAEGRDTYYQCLRESVPFPMAAGQTNARADGNRVVVPIVGAKFPLRCVKTNQPVNAADVRAKKLYWCPPLVFLSILLNLLILIILYYVFRKPVPLEIPISAEGRSRLVKHGFIGFGGLLLGVAFIVMAVAQVVGMEFVAFGALFVLVGLLYVAYKTPMLRVVKYRDGYAWLAGASKEFVASLPAYR